MRARDHLLLLALILQATFSSSADDSCDANCYNGGTCVLRSNGDAKCQCHRYFKGLDCSTVDLHRAEHTVDVESITFKWRGGSILLRNYSIVTHRVGAEHAELRAQPLPENETDEIEVEDLRPERTRYILCILSTKELEEQSSTDLVEIITKLKDENVANCGYVLTAYDGYGPYAKAAVGVVAWMAITLFLLIICSAGHSCRDRERRERLVAEVMGKLEFLSIAATKSSSTQKNSVQEEQSKNEIESVDVVIESIDSPSSEEATTVSTHATRASHLASLDSL